MSWTPEQLFPERYEARLIEPLGPASVIEPGCVPSQVNFVVKEKAEWKLIDQGIQPRRVIRLEE
jgi:hypothetical protein